MARDQVVKQAPRILILLENNAFPWDRRMFHIAEALRLGGYEVRVISPCDDYAKAKFELVDGIEVYRYPMPWQGTGKGGFVLEYLWGLFWMALLVPYVWLRSGFDIIHVANPPDLLFLIALPYKIFGKKLVYDQHDLCPELYESKFQRRDLFHRLLIWFERMSYGAADLVIATNESYREISIERGGVSPGRVVIVRNGVDLGRFHRRSPQKDLKRGYPFMAAYLGVMGTQDGVDRVVRAAHHLVYGLGRKDVLFIMIGKGERWNDLVALSEELKVDDVVKFVGRISDDLLLNYLSTCDVCLAPDPPDRMNQLSTMTKIMEYMACERPIVSFDLLETRRSAGAAAVYVQKEDPKDFAEALSDLLENEAQRDRMGQVGLERTVNLVGLDRSRESLLEAYSGLSGYVSRAAKAGEKDDEAVTAGSRSA